MKKDTKTRGRGDAGNGVDAGGFLFPRNLIVAVTLSMLIVGWTNIAFAQRQTGTITGRVIADDGQPIPHAKVNIAGIGGFKKIMSGRVQIVTDENGAFLADGLDPVAYKVTAYAPGYIQMPDGTAEQSVATGSRFVRVGENVTIRMIRGGVITGRVTNSFGEPVIGIPVETTRVRDENGRPISGEAGVNELVMNRQTDDRGVYRIYGLAPGSYIVSVGSGAFGFSPRPTPFSGRMKIYYPSSSTRDTAQEVSVRSGDEANGIDIRYRSERGFAISGKVSGTPSGEHGVIAMATTVITLTKPGTDSILATTVVMPTGEANSYAFYGLPNGDYEAVATRTNMNDLSGMASAPRRVTINGRDVTGIDLALTPTASISGVVTLEKMNGQKCEAGRESYPDEIVLTPKSDDPKSKAPFKMSFWGNPGTASPDEKGAFSLFGLSAGRHFIEAQLPDEHWFVKAITLTSAPANPAAARNAGNNGVNLKAGEKLSGLTISIAEGAAALKGKVVAPANGKLPARLRVHLLPAEPEAKDEILRFAETKADDDGSFAFANLAPGKYLLVARLIPETESSDKPPNPLAWNIAERAKLRREAEAANQTIELKPCQRASDYALRFSK